MKAVVTMAAVLAAAAPVFPLVGGSWDMMVRILVWAIMGLGFDILFGFTGLLSFGTAAFVGTGGFAAALLLTRGVTDSVWLALLGGTLCAGVLGAALGFFAVRRIGIYFAMITLAFGQMAYFLENGALSGLTGGENGLPGVPLPSLFGHKVLPGPELYALIAALFLIGFALARPDRRLAVRARARRHQGQHRANGDAGARRAPLQACGVHDRGAVCRVQRRAAGQHPELHAA